MVDKAYGDVVCEVPLVQAESGIPGIVEAMNTGIWETFPADGCRGVHHSSCQFAAVEFQY